MKLNILLLCDKPKFSANADTIFDHISSFELYSSHKIWTCSNVGDIPENLALDRFDVIIVHYSLSLLYDHFLSVHSKQRLSQFIGLKVLFVQDEYRQINKMIGEIKLIGFDVLYTCFAGEEIERIYPTSNFPNLVKHNTLTGYVPFRLLSKSHFLKKTSDRKIDVGYRGRKIPFWLGELSYEKYLIAEMWSARSSVTNLSVDISCHENDRLYGHAWFDFVTSCKTTLGVESGASVMDFTGDLEKLINSHQQLYPDDSFYDVQKKYLSAYEGMYKLNQISPRCFEAIALKSVLVLFEGDYSGILVPGRHYIQLKKDFSNFSEVVEKIRDNNYLQNIADVAYKEIALNPEYSYESFINKIDEIMLSEFILRNKSLVESSVVYSESEFIASCVVNSPIVRRAVKHVHENSKLKKLTRFLPRKFINKIKAKYFNSFH